MSVQVETCLSLHGVHGLSHNCSLGGQVDLGRLVVRFIVSLGGRVLRWAVQIDGSLDEVARRIRIFQVIDIERNIFRGVKDRDNAMNLGRDTLKHLVVLESQANLLLVFGVEQGHVKFDWIAGKGALSHVKELVEQLRAHTTTDCVVAFNPRESFAADQEVAANHS